MHLILVSGRLAITRGMALIGGSLVLARQFADLCRMEGIRVSNGTLNGVLAGQ